MSAAQVDEIVARLEQIDVRLDETKSLTVNVSRGLRDLSHTVRSAQRDQADLVGSRRRPADTLVKAACSELLRPSKRYSGNTIVFEKSAGEMARQLYASDYALHDFIQRAATAPATTTVPGNAAELMQQTTVVDFLAGADTPSAFSQLAERCLTVGVSGSIKIPSRAHPSTLAGGWIDEGAPKAVHRIPLSSVTLTPSKLASLVTFSEEIATWSVPAIERVVKDALEHDLAGLLDSALLDSTAATALRPAGLFAGATSVAPSTAMPSSEAMLADLGALAAAVSLNAPDASVAFIANSKQGLRLKAAGFDAVVSNYMTVGSVGAVDTNSLAMMTGGIVFTASINATIHSSDAPLPLATGPQGTAVVATPMTSLFQQDLIGLRSVLRTSWAPRRLTGFSALASGVSW